MIELGGYVARDINNRGQLLLGSKPSSGNTITYSIWDDSNADGVIDASELVEVCLDSHLSRCTPTVLNDSA